MKQTNGRIRLEDIAEALGISRGTVDRALHNRPGVNPDVRERILRTAAELGYNTNRAARSLALQRSITLGVVIPQEPHSYWGGVEEGFRSAAAELRDHGVEVIFLTQPMRDPSLDAKLVRQALLGGIDGLALTPVNTPEMRSLITEVVGAGIPVVTFVTDVPESPRLCFVGNDPWKEGRVGGEVLGKLMQGRGKVLVFKGIQGLHTDTRCIGFRQVIQRDFPGISIASEVELSLPASLIAERTEAALEQHPDVGGIFVANAFAEFICPVLARRGMADQVRLVGFDLTPHTEGYLRSGAVDAVITQNSFRQGYETLRILADYVLERKAPPGPMVYGSIAVVFRELL
jgi:LacI family transcriptional regulator